MSASTRSGLIPSRPCASILTNVRAPRTAGVAAGQGEAGGGSSLLLVDLAADHLEGRLSVHHSVSCELLSAAGTLKLAFREVLNDALFVALHQRAFASLLIPVACGGVQRENWISYTPSDSSEMHCATTCAKNFEAFTRSLQTETHEARRLVLNTDKSFRRAFKHCYSCRYQKQSSADI